MKCKIKTKDGLQLSLNIITASALHVEGLMELNKRWQKEILGNDSSRGLLSAAFNEDTFKALVNCNEVIAGLADNRIAGYYLVNSISTDGVLLKHSEIVQGLKFNSILPGASVGLGT